MKVSLKQIIKSLPFLLFFLFLINACKKTEQYPIVPLIEFKDYYVQLSSKGTDSIATLIFSFKDGDGDIGYPDEDSVSKSIHTYYYKKMNGVFNLTVKPEDIINYDVKLPMILSAGVKRPIKGDIEYSIDISSDLPGVNKYDTIKVEFTLVDRALNLSNMISTPEMVFRKKP